MKFDKNIEDALIICLRWPQPKLIPISNIWHFEIKLYFYPIRVVHVVNNLLKILTYLKPCVYWTHSHFCPQIPCCLQPHELLFTNIHQYLRIYLQNKSSKIQLDIATAHIQLFSVISKTNLDLKPVTNMMKLHDNYQT